MDFEQTMYDSYIVVFCELMEQAELCLRWTIEHQLSLSWYNINQLYVYYHLLS